MTGGEKSSDEGRSAERRHDDPVIPDRSADDTDEGWSRDSERDDDDRYLRERPPHWA